MHYIISVALLIMVNAANAAESPLEKRCDVLTKKHIAHFKDEFRQDYTLIETESFYSKNEASCFSSSLMSRMI